VKTLVGGGTLEEFCDDDIGVGLWMVNRTDGCNTQGICHDDWFS
jgi:hypothetical protein